MLSLPIQIFALQKVILIMESEHDRVDNERPKMLNRRQFVTLVTWLQLKDTNTPHLNLL